MRANRSHLRAGLAALVGACGVFLLAAVGGLGSVGAACAQTTPTIGIPTLGPIDPACQRVPDTDNDGVYDYQDNCHRFYNPSQKDTDNDAGAPPYEPVPVTQRDPMTGGDACDIDDDGDLVKDVTDNCPKNANKDQKDTDGDGVGDACDPQPTVPNQVTPGGAKPAGIPKLSLRSIATTQHLAEVQAGIVVPAHCTAPCTLAAELIADKRTARRLGAKGVVVAKAVGGLEGAGDTYVFLRLSKKTLAKLRKAKRSKLTVLVVASDDVGHTSKASRRVTVLR